MHVHASYNVPVAYKATAPTGPVASFRLLLPVASRTVATGSPLTATEARDANLFTLVLQIDRKSTRLNSSHQIISYAVFCLKKKKPSTSHPPPHPLPPPQQLPHHATP